MLDRSSKHAFFPHLFSFCLLAFWLCLTWIIKIGSKGVCCLVMQNIADFRFPCFPQNTAGRTAETCGRRGNANSIYSWGNGIGEEKLGEFTHLRLVLADNEMLVGIEWTLLTFYKNLLFRISRYIEIILLSRSMVYAWVSLINY